MKNIIFLLLTIVSIHNCLAQKTSKYAEEIIAPQNIEYFKIVFEIEDFVPTTQADTILINNIDLDQYEELREENVDVEIEIEIDNVEYNLILYSVQKAGIKKSNIVLEFETE